MRYISSVLNQLLRNSKASWTSQLMTLFTVSLSVLIFSFFFQVYTNMIKASHKLGDELRLIIYMEDEIPESFREEFTRKITNFSEVEKIIFVSQQEAFSRLSALLANEADVLEGLDSSFLPYSVEIYPNKDLVSLTRVKAFSKYLETLPGALKVQYGQNWIERFGYFTTLLRLIVVLSGALLALTSIFMVSYTIRLSLESRREELEILRFLGATDSYISGPVIFEGLLLGVGGTGLGTIFLLMVYQWIKSNFSGPSFINLFEFSFLPPLTILAICAISILLCSGGSLISLRKYLRV